jgi:hypothetical protein
VGALFTVAATTGTFATAGTAATTVTPAITAGTAATTVTAAFTAAVSGGRRLQFRRESRRSSRLRGERRRRRGVRGRLAVLRGAKRARESSRVKKRRDFSLVDENLRLDDRRPSSPT